MNAAVETLHQLALRLGGRLDEQLGGGDELPGLRGEQLLGSAELGVAPLRDVSIGAERPGLSDVDHDLSYNLLRLLDVARNGVPGRGKVTDHRSALREGLHVLPELLLDPPGLIVISLQIN